MRFNPLIRLSQVKVPQWLGPCASLLCLIHCFSLPVLIILIPGLPKLIGENLSHRLDFLFWIISAVVGYRVLEQIAAPAWTRIVFAITAILGISFLMVESHNLFHIFLVSMAVIQLVATILKHRSSRLNPTCCAHEHAHEHEMQLEASKAEAQDIQA